MDRIRRLEEERRMEGMPALSKKSADALRKGTMSQKQAAAIHKELELVKVEFRRAQLLRCGGVWVDEP